MKYNINKFQNGGTNYFRTDKVQYVDSVLNANKDKDWVRRLTLKNTPSIVTPKSVPGYKPGMRSTHLMSDNNQGYVFPEVATINGKLTYLGNKAEDYARETSTGIQLPVEQGTWFARNGYKKGTNVLKGLANGGVIKAQSGVKLPNIITDSSIGKHLTFDQNFMIGRRKPINFIGQPINKQVNIPKADATKLQKVLPTAEKMNKLFIGSGYTPEQSAGMIGNFAVESHLKADTNQHGGGPGFGLGQWEKGNPRYNNLVTLSKTMKKPITDESVQLAYLNTELNSPKREYIENAWGGRGRREKFLKSDSVDKSASNFSELFLRPGKPNMEKRIQYSQYIYDQLND